MNFRLLSLATLSAVALAGCYGARLPDPALSGRDAEFMALAPKAQVSTQFERYLVDYLGVSNVIWLNGGVENDETDGHVDGQACFLRPGVVLASVCSDPEHPAYEVLQDTLAILRRSTDAHGKPLEIIEIEMPYKTLEDGTPVSAYYVNIYFANGAIIRPAFDFPKEDLQARDFFAREVPEREIVQIPTHDISFGGGNIHCITPQQPAALASPRAG